MELEDEAGNTTVYRIVGADEFDPGHNWISVDSPMARALLGRALDEEVSVQTPGGRRTLLVVEVRYEAP